MQTHVAPASYRDLFDPDEYLQEFEEFLPSVQYTERNPLNTEMFYLWCMIRSQKPELYIESGTYQGYSATFACEALSRNNNDAEFITVGFDLDDCLRHARARLDKYPFAQVIEADSREFIKARASEQKRTAFFIDGPKGRNMFPLFKIIRERFEHFAFIAIHDCEREGTSHNRFRVRQFYGLDYPLLFCGTDFQTAYREMDVPLIGRSEMVDWKPFFFNGQDRESYGTETAYVLPGYELKGRWPQPIRDCYRTVVSEWLRGFAPTPPERSG